MVKHKKYNLVIYQEAGQAYQASGLGSLFISSSLEDIHRCKGKGGLEGETETLRLNASTL